MPPSPESASAAVGPERTGASPGSAPTPAVSPASPQLAVHGALIAVQLAFASLAVVGKIALRSVDPGSLALVRLTGAALVFLAMWARGPRERVRWPDVLAICGCATLGIASNQLFFLHGLRLTSAVNATLLVATIPIFTVLTAILFGREAPRARTLAGIVLAFVGVAWLVGVEAVEVGGDSVLGDLLVLANSVVYALYLVLVRGLVARYGSVPVVAIGFAWGAIFALPFGAPGLIEHAAEIDAATWWLVLYVVLVATVFTYLANAWALRSASASVVAIYIYLQPPIAALLAWMFLDEMPSGRLIPTTIAVFAGIWLVTRPPPVKPAPL